MNHGNFQQGHKCFRQISRLCARLAGKNPSNGYPNKLVAPLSGRKKMKNLEQWRTKQQFSWEMNLQHSTLFLIKKIILFYENFLKDGLLLNFQNFKRKLYANSLDKRPSIYYVRKRTVWVSSKHGTFCWRSVVDQSICTHYSCFENMGRFVTLKKNQVQNMDLKKAS